MQNRLLFRISHLWIILLLSISVAENSVSADNAILFFQSDKLNVISNKGKIWFVHDLANGANNGQSWTDAFTSIQSALDIAVSGDEIWVASGTYRPSNQTDANDPRSATFQLENGITIYGGFVGTELNLEDRDWETNPTILSGDVDHNDSANPAHSVDQIIGNNAYHVVTGNTTDSSSILDGFTITAGKTKDEVSYVCAPSCGGGMIVVSGSPTIRNILFIGNSARFGGGLGAYQSNLSVSATKFESNSAGLGGGMYNLSSDSSVDQIIFLNNSSGAGGGMYNARSNPSISNVTFRGNNASNGAGLSTGDYSDHVVINALFDRNIASNIGGAIENDYYGKLTLVNVTIINNTAIRTGDWTGAGGGIWNGDHSNVTLINVTIADNTSTYAGGINNIANSSITVRNSIIWENIPDQILDGFGSTHTANHSDIQGGIVSPGMGNINIDPKLGPIGNYGGSVQVVPLQPGSPAINKVPQSQCLDMNGVFLTYDQRGATRPQGGACDMGAFEVIMQPIFLPIIYK